MKTEGTNVLQQILCSYDNANAPRRLALRCLLFVLITVVFFPVGVLYAAMMESPAPAINIWPALQTAIHLITVVGGFLFLRWIPGQIKSSIQELELRLVEKYATKDDIKRVEGEINLAGRIDRGFNRTLTLLRDRGAASSSPMVDR